MKTKTQTVNVKDQDNTLKWRQHELLLVTAIMLISLAGYVWFLFHTSGDQLASAFKATHTPFNFYKNILLPHLSIGLFAYLAYLWCTLYTLPRLLFPKKVEAGMSKISLSFSGILLLGQAKKMVKEYAWLFTQIVLIVLILGVVTNIAVYYKNQWLFHYPGFSIFFDRNNPRSQMDLGGGFFAVAASLAFYGLYIWGRETIINLIHSSKHREYNTAICNKVTIFLVLLITIYTFLQAFDIIHEQQFFVKYLLVISALFAMFISNVYWLFPMKGTDPFFSKKIITRLLTTSFVYAVPLVVFINEERSVGLLYSWAFQLFITTPLTWWYYQYNKDNILQLRVVEKELVRSKADLQFLRSQINPHFLFNVLNTLYGAALQEKAERTAAGIQKLGDMMRFMLHENNLDFIQMNKEIEYLNNYIALQKLRTQSSPEIIIEDNITKQNCSHQIAPMLLIPLVENAFKHGLSLQERSWIKIDLTCDDKKILFEVNNSMHAETDHDPEKDVSGIGFKNVLERLKLIYPGKFQIAVNKDGKEFSVKLSIEP